MAQIAAMRPDRIVSPDQRSLIGSVYVAGEKSPPNPEVSGVEVDVKNDQFEAKLRVDHGRSVRAHLIFRTDAEGTLYVREELEALKDVIVTRVATGMIGVLNNKQWIYETGRRTLKLDNESTVIPAHSGKTLVGQGNRIVIDDAMMILSDARLRVRYIASSGPHGLRQPLLDVGVEADRAQLPVGVHVARAHGARETLAHKLREHVGVHGLGCPVGEGFEDGGEVEDGHTLAQETLEDGLDGADG